MNQKKNNFPTLSHKAIIILIIGGVFLLIAIWWVIYLQRAHSTFENYYAFRGCVETVNKTDSEATCRLKDGEIIKLVKYQEKWFLDGDLPTGRFLDF